MLISCLLQNHFGMACLRHGVSFTSNTLFLCDGIGLYGGIAPGGGGGGGVDVGWARDVVRLVVTRLGTTAFTTMCLVGSVPTR